MTSLKSKKVLILGGTSGIGLAIAQQAALEGATPIVVSSTPARVEAARRVLPDGARGHVVDLSREAEVKSLFEREPELDHLVFTAGDTLQIGPIADSDVATAQRFFQVRYWGAYTAAKYAAPRLRAGGSIVLSSGLAAARPFPGWSLGASVCAAMEGLTRALAVELAPLRVNVVAPGVVVTPLWDPLPAADRQALFEHSAANLLVRHVAEPAAIAEAYLFLMRQTYITGEVLRIDGGGALV